MFDRMDPLSAQHLRELQSTSGGPPAIPLPRSPTPAPFPNQHPGTTQSPETRPYTAAELQAALVSPQARPLGDEGTAPEQAPAVIEEYWQWAYHLRDAAAQQAQLNHDRRQRIAWLRAELRDMRLCVDHVLLAREAQRRTERRNRRILRQLSAELRRARYEARHRREQLGAAFDVAARLESEEQVLTAGLQAEFARAGLADADAVRAEAGREFLERLRGLRDMC